MSEGVFCTMDGSEERGDSHASTPTYKCHGSWNQAETAFERLFSSLSDFPPTDHCHFRILIKEKFQSRLKPDVDLKKESVPDCAVLL